MNDYQIMNRPRSGCFRRALFLALFAVLGTGALSAQQVTLPEKEMRADQAMAVIEQQTGMRFGTSEDFDAARSVNFGKTSLTLGEAAGKLAGKDFAHTIHDKYILIHRKAGKKPAMENIGATVIDRKAGTPLTGVKVEIVTGAAGSTVTDAAGYFRINSVPGGKYIVRLSSADGKSVQYKEIATNTNPSPDVRILFDLAPADEMPVEIVREQPIVYYYNKPAEQYDFDYSFVEAGGLYKGYRSKVALKTNLLIWATTTPNGSLEVRLGKRWTLDAAVAYNPWRFGSEKSHRFWFVQPELRYWFCEAFENHFIGVHGIYGKYNIGNSKLPFTDIFDYTKYKGKAYGGGISYGYHLPIGKRWGIEFTVGAGYVYLDYDKYKCGSCDEFEGNFDKHYIGPTKAGVTLIFMIK